MKIFEFVAIFNGDEKKKEPAKIIVAPTVILARDDKEAMLKAARAIPEDYVERLDQVEIAVRPLGCGCGAFPESAY